MNRKEENEKEQEFEACVLCGCLTDVLKSEPVGERKTYISGSGQLCRKCCWEIYKTLDVRDAEGM